MISLLSYINVYLESKLEIYFVQIDEIFELHLRKEISCNNCNKLINEKFEIEKQLIVEFDENTSSLSESIRNYFNENLVDCFCLECGQNVATIKTQLLKPPECLIILLKRNSSNMDKEINYQEFVDLNTILSNENYDLYKLFSIVLYDNLLKHYSVIIRKAQNWYKCNDSNVNLITSKKIFNHKNSFMLFYERESTKLPTTNCAQTQNLICSITENNLIDKIRNSVQNIFKEAKFQDPIINFSYSNNNMMFNIQLNNSNDIKLDNQCLPEHSLDQSTSENLYMLNHSIDSDNSTFDTSSLLITESEQHNSIENSSNNLNDNLLTCYFGDFKQPACKKWQNEKDGIKRHLFNEHASFTR